MFFQKDLETMPRREIEALQLTRLKHLVKYCYDNVPFYHNRLEKQTHAVCHNSVCCLFSTFLWDCRIYFPWPDDRIDL